MRQIGGFLFGCGLLVLAGCSSTTIATTANDNGASSTVSATESATVESDAGVDTTEEAAAATTEAVVETSAAETTEAETTEADTTVAPTTIPATTVPESTTTTVAPERKVSVPAIVPPIEAVGNNSGEATKRAQWRLLQLGFWLAEPNGEFDLTTSQAVFAFQKYYGLERDGQLGPETANYLSLVTIRPHGRTDSDTLVEVDKNKQVLYLVRDGVTEWVLNISSGSEVPYDYASKDDPNKREKGDAVTRNGLHTIYREQADGWWDGDLGKIYRPKYFTGGIAFHGYNNVPPYPASHGCVRLSLPAMDWIWDNDLMPQGTPVWVHDGAPEEYESVNVARAAVWDAATGKNQDDAAAPADDSAADAGVEVDGTAPADSVTDLAAPADAGQSGDSSGAG